MIPLVESEAHLAQDSANAVQEVPLLVEIELSGSATRRSRQERVVKEGLACREGVPDCVSPAVLSDETEQNHAMKRSLDLLSLEWVETGRLERGIFTAANAVSLFWHTAIQGLLTDGSSASRTTRRDVHSSAVLRIRRSRYVVCHLPGMLIMHQGGSLWSARACVGRRRCVVQHQRLEDERRSSRG